MTRTSDEIRAELAAMPNLVDAWVPALDACERRRLHAELREAEIREALARNDADYRSLMEQAGAMGMADTGTRLAVQGLYRARERLLAELRGEAPAAPTL